MTQSKFSDQAKAESVTATDPGTVPLRPYDSANDQFTAGRYRRFLLFVIVPLALVCGGLGWVLFVPKNQTVAPAPPTSVYGSKIPAAPLSGATLIPSPQSNTALGGVLSAPPRAVRTPIVPGAVYASVDDLKIRCYAKEDNQAVNGQWVLKDGLFWAEKYVRVRGGMLWNDRFGWVYLKSFGCAPGLESLEVEYWVPSPTPARAKVNAVAAPRSVETVWIVPTLAPLPTPTYTSGIVAFFNTNCEIHWLVWNVKEVFLTYGGNTYGVPGDANGQMVVRSICPYTGMVKLSAMGNGQVYGQQIEVR